MGLIGLMGLIGMGELRGLGGLKLMELGAEANGTYRENSTSRTGTPCFRLSAF